MSEKNIWNKVPESVHNRVLVSLDSLENTKSARTHVGTLFKVAAACFVVVFVSGVTVYAAEAIQAYKQRMVELNRQQLEEYYAAAFLSETIRYSRDLTKEERARYEELKEKYEKEGYFPKGAVKYLEKAEDYRGKGVALHAETGILYLPDKELKDEEILQIIDFFRKVEYSIHVFAQEYWAEQNPWQERMQAMSSEEVDKIYLVMYSGEGEISGAYSRRLTDEERLSYEEMLQGYENENWIPSGELSIMETPEEYTEGNLAFCIKNSTFYLPDRMLTDEEFLQIIDLEHKALYCMSRINEEINMGFRTERPHK